MSDASEWGTAYSPHESGQRGTLDEVEPMNKEAIIGRGAIVDASEIEWELPTEQKWYAVDILQVDIEVNIDIKVEVGVVVKVVVDIAVAVEVVVEV